MSLIQKTNQQDKFYNLYDNGISVVCLDREAIFALGQSWENLSRNALEDNAYYAPAFMLPLLKYVEAKDDIKALVIYRREQMIGFLPFQIDRWRWLGASPVNLVRTGPYITSTIPLIDKDHSDAAIAALVSAMSEAGTGGNFWLFSNFNLEGKTGALLQAELSDRGMSSCLIETYERPVMMPGGSFDEHMKSQVSSARRRDLARNRRRLQKLGKVVLRSYTSGPQLDGAVEDFLRIEASGWKGEKGTALGCDKSLSSFARAAFGSNNGKPAARADMLYLDETAIAVSLSAQCGRTAFTLKCAYDEAYKSYSPGLLLEQDIIESFLNDGWADCMDSAVTVESHVIADLWNSHILASDLFVCTDPAKPPKNFSHYMKIETMRRRTYKLLKDVVHRVRDVTAS